MPRIRTIKPEFWSSPSVCGADPWARLLFIAMWNWADDSGRGTANVKELAAFAFPHDEDHPDAPTAAELPTLLTEIRGRFGVVFYEVDGRRYYEVPTWDRHQRNERRAKSKYPGPDDGSEYDPLPPDLRESKPPTNGTEVPPHSHGNSDASDGSSGTGTGEQGNRGTGESPNGGEPSSPTIGKRANDLAKLYYDRVPLSKFPAIAAVAKKAITSGRYSDDQIGQALVRLANEGRSVTVDVLRYELDGFPASKAKQSTSDQRVYAAQALKQQIALLPEGNA